jgi:hypothetical protein
MIEKNSLHYRNLQVFLLDLNNHHQKIAIKAQNNNLKNL